MKNKLFKTTQLLKEKQLGFFVAAEGGTPIHPIGLGVAEATPRFK